VTFLPNIIKDGLLLVTTWLLKLFGFDSAAEDVANAKKWTIGSMIVGVFKSVKKWLFGVFGFGTDEEGKDKPIQIKGAKDFSLVTMISDTMTKIWDWFKDLIDIDMMAIAKKIPGYDTFMSIFGSKDKTPEELKQDKKRTADMKAKAQKVQNVDPGAMGASGGFFGGGRRGGLLVGELGPELIFPSSGVQVMNATRTAQMQESGLQRGAGSAGGSPTIVNAPTTSINNSSSNMTNTTTSFSHPSAILNTVNAAA
jgi:hypothetical protein